MSKSIILDKFLEFKKLNDVCNFIKEKASKVELADRLLIDGKVIMFPPVIFKVLFTSNPIYEIDMVCDDNDKLTEVKVRADYDFDKELEENINSVYDFKKANRKSDEFTVMEEIVAILNAVIKKIFIDHPTLLVPELETYLDQMMPLLKNCMDTIELLEFHKKGTIMRILKENYRFAGEIKSYFKKDPDRSVTNPDTNPKMDSVNNTKINSPNNNMKGEWF